MSVASIAQPASPRASAYGWLVFALTFGLLLSDYMSRQVLAAVFPMLKSEWRLSDMQLGALSGVVGLAVAALSAPLSYVADKAGRVPSLVAMAAIWSIATLCCGLAQTYQQMFAARLFVGAGEAAYGSVGAALILSHFPEQRRGMISAAFLAGATVGSVLGVSLGGAISRVYGWRAAFEWMAMAGLALALVYPLMVKSDGRHSRREQPNLAAILGLLRLPTVAITYVAGGVQLFISAALISWLPSLLERTYAMPADRAAIATGGLLLVSGIGSVACGALSDRFARNRLARALSFAAIVSAATFALICTAFFFAPGWMQALLLALGLACAGGAIGPVIAVVAGLTDSRVRGSAFALIALGNNVFGIAPGPIVAGYLADRGGLVAALQLASCASMIAAAIFLWARAVWPRDVAS